MKKLFALALALFAVPLAVHAYIIQPGDTLSSIAANHGTTVDALVEMNNITNPDLIYAGNELFVDQLIGSIALPEDGYDTFITAPVSSGDTEIFVNVLPSFVTSSIYTIFGSDGRTVREKVFCTSKSASPNKLTGCTRGLSAGPDGSGVIDETAGTGLSHSRNARIAITDNINFSGKALSILSGNQPSGTTTLDIGALTTTSLRLFADTSYKGIYSRNGGANLPFVRYNESISKWQFSDNGTDTVNLATSTGAGLSASSTAGIGITNSEIYLKASSTVGYTFDSNGNLYRPVSSSTGIEADASGLKLNTTTITDLIATTTPTADKIVRAGSDGKIDSGWVNLSFAFGDGNDGTVNINSGSFSSGPISNNALTRDAYFDNLTLSGGDLNTAGYKLYVKGTLTIDSTYKIHRNGNDGGNGGNGATGASGGAAGSAGAAASALSGGTLPGAVAGIAGTAGGSGTQSAGNNSSGANNGTAVSVSVGGTGVAGVAGGAGGDATNGSGGSAGSVGAAGARTAASTQPRNIFDANRLIQVTGDTTFSRLLGTTGTGGSSGGGGGGGWTSGSDTGGGGGGAGGSGSAGGFVAVYASTIVNNGSIEALGGNGGDGGDGGDGEQPGSSPGVTGGGGGGASGSGGSGGVIVIVYDSLSGSGSIDVSGGSPGTPGTFGNGYNVSGIVPSANGSAGSTGNTGGDGVIYQIEI